MGITFDTNDIHAELKDGIVLCRLLNVLEPGIIRVVDDNTPLHALEERVLVLMLCNCRGIFKGILMLV